MQSPSQSTTDLRQRHQKLFHEMSSVGHNESFGDKGPPMSILEMGEDPSMFERGEDDIENIS